jgi:hypothetical protein
MKFWSDEWFINEHQFKALQAIYKGSRDEYKLAIAERFLIGKMRMFLECAEEAVFETPFEASLRRFIEEYDER